jgi:hypothetical protein
MSLLFSGVTLLATMVICAAVLVVIGDILIHGRRISPGG